MAERPLPSASSQRPKWTELNELSSASIGGEVLFATDDWFAAAENLLVPGAAVWKEGFTEQGKWMDGWETRRKRIPGHDWCIVRLGLAGRVHGVELDTSFFTGNFTPKASVQGASLLHPAPLPPRQGGPGKAASEEELRAVGQLESDKWTTLAEMTPLGSGYKDSCLTFLPSLQQGPFTHLRLNMFPDGGIARLRAYGVAVPLLPPGPGELDLMSAENGGVCIGYSDAHYGHPRNIIKSGRGVDMGDGWETARNPLRPEILRADAKGILQVPGSEWAAFRLGLAGTVVSVEVDTVHFKGNFPDSVTLEAATLGEGQEEQELLKEGGWRVLLPPTKLQAHKQHFFPAAKSGGAVTHVRVTMFPDGGISRLRVRGHIAL